jgi:drug/metabolite transporter (DMT)-like permease
MTGERLSGARLAGLGIGFAGVVALLGFDVAGRATELLGAALVLLATLGYAIAPIIVSRRLADLDPLGPVTGSLVVATLALLPAALATFPHRMPAPSALLAITVLGVICTAVGLLVFFRLIAEAGPSRASVITYVNPLVAVVVGVVHWASASVLSRSRGWC